MYIIMYNYVVPGGCTMKTTPSVHSRMLITVDMDTFSETVTLKDTYESPFEECIEKHSVSQRGISVLVDFGR